MKVHSESALEFDQAFKTTYILQDWAGNRLTDRQGLPLDFKSFDDGWAYIQENYEQEDFQELFVSPIVQSEVL